MNIGELWWNRLVNSVRFLDDSKDILITEKSMVLSFPDGVPFSEDMLSFLEQKLSVLTVTRSFIVRDVSEVHTDPGKYLFEHFCSESERKKYWPSISYAYFLATNDHTILHRRILCITGLNASNTAEWVKVITEYLENRNSDDQCIFILITNSVNIHVSKVIAHLKYSDYVTDYDCLMLCLTLLSSEKCSSIQKQYVSELASNISHNQPEIAGLLALEGIPLAKDPIRVARKVFQDHKIVVTGLQKRVLAAVWETQIKLVFPRLENLRRNLIQKYNEAIQPYLSMVNFSGEWIEKAADMEIGQLFFVCGKEKILSKSDFELLSNMRYARNLLAHREILDYQQLSEFIK